MMYINQGEKLAFSPDSLSACYRDINAAIRRVLSAGQPPRPKGVNGRSAVLFTAPAYGREAYELLRADEAVESAELVEAYFADVPSPVLFGELDEAQLSHFIGWFGPDIMRANFLSGNLVDNRAHRPLISGGACALETWATRLLGKSFLERNPDLRCDALLEILENAPYYTQLTGTMMLGSPGCPQVMYDETFPWFMSIYDLGKSPHHTPESWSIHEIEAVTRDLYERIHATVERRANLIAGEPQEIFRVPFEALDLERSGRLEDWYHRYTSELPKTFVRYLPTHYQHDSFIGAYVRYTYVGPDLLDLVKQVLDSQSPEIDAATIHVRAKQDDHLYEGRRINRILLQGIHDDDHAFLNNYANLCNLAIYFWHQRHWRSGNAFVGFHDLSFRGNIVHDTIDLETGSNNDFRTEEELWDVLRSPVRLHRHNVEEHFRYLDRHVEEACVHQEVAAALAKLKTKRDKHRQKLAGVEARARERGLAHKVITRWRESAGADGIEAVVTAAEMVASLETSDPASLLKEMRGIPRVYRRRSRIAKVSGADELFDLLESGTMLEPREDGAVIRVARASMGWPSMLGALLESIEDDLRVFEEKSARERASLEHAESECEAFMALHAGIAPELFRYSESAPALLPLRDNLVFCHAVQLAFDPHVARFLLEAEGIESSPMEVTAKRQLVLKATRGVLPRIKCLLRRLMTGECRDGTDDRRLHYRPVLAPGHTGDSLQGSALHDR